MSAPSPYIRNIALVGATGNVGAQILRHLLATSTPSGPFHITIITRSDSKAPDLPSSDHISVERGSYTDTAFLASAFSGQDAVIFALGFMAMEAQSTMLDAAVAAGVPWILPTEYAGDGANDGMVDAVPLFWPKREARKRVLAASGKDGKSRFVGVVTNPWVPFSLQTGMFGIDPYEKRATLYEDAGPFNVSTLEQVGKGVAALLALPVTNSKDPRCSLEHYANGFVYISSALTSQAELFAAALKATGTTESEWEVRRSSCKERLRAAQEAAAKGDMRAGADGTYAVYMGEGMGGNIEAKAREDREVLGLRTGGVEGIVRAAVEKGPFRVM